MIKNLQLWFRLDGVSRANRILSRMDRNAVALEEAVEQIDTEIFGTKATIDALHKQVEVLSTERGRAARVADRFREFVR